MSSSPASGLPYARRSCAGAERFGRRPRARRAPSSTPTTSAELDRLLARLDRRLRERGDLRRRAVAYECHASTYCRKRLVAIGALATSLVA